MVLLNLFGNFQMSPTCDTHGCKKDKTVHYKIQFYNTHQELTQVSYVTAILHPD